jgi:hypothetical protein
MLKRIGLLLAAALLVATMAVAVAGSVFATPNCALPQHADHPHCQTTLPSGNEPNPNSNACGNNPQCEHRFDNPSPNN